MLRLSLILLLLVGSCVLPTGGKLPEPWMLDEFKLAQEKLFTFFGDPKIWEVSIDQFNLQVVLPLPNLPPGANHFLCGSKPAVGCYKNGGKIIEYLANVPTVLRHEFGHGIAEVLDLHKEDCGWREWEHQEGCP